MWRVECVVECSIVCVVLYHILWCVRMIDVVCLCVWYVCFMGCGFQGGVYYNGSCRCGM